MVDRVVSLGCVRVRALGLVGVVFALALCMVTPALAAAPEAPETTAASSVAASSATLHGVLNPHSESLAGYEFTYSSNGSCEGLATEPQPEALVEALAVEASLSGLEPAREYMFCLLATHLEGETPENMSGSAVSFKTLAAPPVVDAESVSAVGSSAVTFEAQVNPNDEATTFSFEYATSEDLKGATTVTGAEALAAEFGDRFATVPRVEGLEPGTTYFYRVVAENAQSEEEKAPVSGAVQSFSTPPAPFTDPVSNVTAQTATLNGHLSLSLVEAQFFFAFNVGEGCAGAFVVAAEPPSGVGAGESVETAQASGLQPNATYSACLLTQNASGSQLGEPVQFKTLPAPPSVEAGSESASSVTDTSAALASLINPNNQETVFRWMLATEEAGGELLPPFITTPGEAPLSGFGAQSADVTVKGLEPRTTYFYRVLAENASEEESTGPVQSFTTLDKPLVTASEAQKVTRTQAALSGTVNPGGLETSYHFVYVEAAEYLPGAEECVSPPCAYAQGAVTGVERIGPDYEAHATGPVQIGELKPGTTYDYALVATNSLGTRVSANQELTTLPATPPTATTGGARNVTQLTATITGSVDTRGIPTTMQFELLPAGSPVGQGSLIAATAGEQFGSVVAISLTFPEDLQPNSTYYYRALATNADGTAEGALQSFTTTAFPAPGGFTLTPGLPVLSFSSIAELEAKEASEHHPGPTHLTNRQKLAKALKACHRIKNKTRRHACEHQAHKRYPAKKARK